VEKQWITKTLARTYFSGEEPFPEETVTIESNADELTPLQSKMQKKLQGSRFRWINEKLYRCDTNAAVKLFRDDPSLFEEYHAGYRNQVSKWPVNPLGTIIKFFKKKPRDWIVGDFGCGDCVLAKSIPQQCYSFDLVKADDLVTVCDMAHTPLEENSIDVAVYCLSLMGSNLGDIFLECYRVLKPGGLIKICEVKTRTQKLIQRFVRFLSQFNFVCCMKSENHPLFSSFTFKLKDKNTPPPQKLRKFAFNVCKYKKR